MINLSAGLTCFSSGVSPSLSSDNSSAALLPVYDIWRRKVNPSRSCGTPSIQTPNPNVNSCFEKGVAFQTASIHTRPWVGHLCSKQKAEISQSVIDLEMFRKERKTHFTSWRCVHKMSLSPIRRSLPFASFCGRPDLTHLTENRRVEGAKPPRLLLKVRDPSSIKRGAAHSAVPS
ncbi:hypothetical protein CDAR_497141 [Caerostris darwini]|uniref:Uncharacterized protein n=1 Tax=Caerostris darwini TaxID=1538125 RepID=A0AAV4RZ01_9ARAC|nr:hypothetical protein CDAR_497141 [Caerostris darwini]